MRGSLEVRGNEVKALYGAQRAPIVDGGATTNRIYKGLTESAGTEGVSLLNELRQLPPGVIRETEGLRLAHGLLPIPASDSHQLPSGKDLHEGVIGSAEIHLSLLNERVVSLIELEKLLPLLSSANVYLAIQVTLQYCAEVSKGVLHVLQIDYSLREVLAVVQDQLLFVRHEHCHPILLGEHL